jgi:predicted RNA-binding protein Jag
VRTEDPGRLIGRGGRVLNNFDYLLNRIIAGKFEEQVRAKIDVEGREGRPRKETAAGKPAAGQAGGGGDDKPVGGQEDGAGADEDEKRLRKLALDAAKEVKRWGDAKTIGPFSPGERRVIHAALKADGEVRAESGEELPGRKKRITVAPAE